MAVSNAGGLDQKESPLHLQRAFVVSTTVTYFRTTTIFPVAGNAAVGAPETRLNVRYLIC